jgi:ATP-dependent DNA helicase HFM1/MER3
MNVYYVLFCYNFTRMNNFPNQLVSVSDVLEPRFQNVFGFKVFNHMQSAIVMQTLEDNATMVVAAPTGSGKTAILELAILHSIKDLAPHKLKSFKSVYIAPNKALCQQKKREWDQAFSTLGLTVLEVTGDIEFKDSMRFIAMANIIVTTPEKWDSLTRTWKDHLYLLGAVDLLLLDEIHHLGEDRGATLEALIVRMRMLSNVYAERRNIDAGSPVCSR